MNKVLFSMVICFQFSAPAAPLSCIEAANAILKKSGLGKDLRQLPSSTSKRKYNIAELKKSISSALEAADSVRPTPEQKKHFNDAIKEIQSLRESLPKMLRVESALKEINVEVSLVSDKDPIKKTPLYLKLVEKENALKNYLAVNRLERFFSSLSSGIPLQMKKAIADGELHRDLDSIETNFPGISFINEDIEFYDRRDLRVLQKRVRDLESLLGMLNDETKNWGEDVQNAKEKASQDLRESKSALAKLTNPAEGLGNTRFSALMDPEISIVRQAGQISYIYSRLVPDYSGLITCRSGRVFTWKQEGATEDMNEKTCLKSGPQDPCRKLFDSPEGTSKAPGRTEAT